MAAHIPGGGQERGNQAAGKHASGLQCVEAENLAPVVGVVAPVVDDVENFGAYDSGEHDENAEVPGIVSIDSLLFGIADADPKADQHARSDEEAISGQIKTANVKESGEHVGLDAPNVG